MITLSGKSVFGGVAIGKIAFYKRQEKQVRRYHVEDTEAEAARFEDAQETAIAQLGELYDKAMEEDIRKYFPKNYTKSDMQKTIISLLEKWQKQRERNRRDER